MAEGKRNRFIKLYCSAEEYEAICTCAAEEGVSASAYARSRVVGRSVSETPMRPRAVLRKVRKFKASDEEWEELKARAATVGVSASGYIRRSCLYGALGVFDVEALNALRYEVYKVGVNVNQVAHRLNVYANEHRDEDVAAEAKNAREAGTQVNEMMARISEVIGEQRSM